MNVNTVVRFGLVTGGLVTAVVVTKRFIKAMKGMSGVAPGGDEYPPYHAKTS